MKRIGVISDTHGTFDEALRAFLKDVDEIAVKMQCTRG